MQSIPRVVWLCCLVTASCLAASTGLQKKPVTRPPRITRESQLEISYKTEERVELPCVALGEPRPAYEWLKDGSPLEIDGVHYKRQPGVGTLVIDNPTESHEGKYQCLAKNELGTALSVTTTLKLAVLQTFPTVGEPYMHKPVVGTSLKLACTPPYSYPAGFVYWGKTKPGTKFNALETTARVSLDYGGNLYFANIKLEDNIGEDNYVCIVQNTRLRSMSQGDDAVIYPFASGPTPTYAAPMVQWTSESPTVVIQGQRKKMKCIFSGYPTPTVRWDRIGGPLAEKVEQTSFGQEIIIPNAQYGDAGKYRCLANNTKGGTPVSRTFELSVQSLPLWVTEPESVDSSEEETAEFNCEAGGVPKPSVTWYVNGRPIEEVENDRRRIDGTRILFTNLSKSDAQVLQCNASNKHGYIFKNAYLNVLAEPPSFIQPPLPVVKVAEGQNVNLTCRVFGAPKPIISWWRGDEKVTGSRLSIMKTGDLQILSVRRADDGTYECSAWNKFGEEQKSGNLIVRQRTVITRGPEEMSMNVSQDVILHCDATTDNAEKARLKIEWRRNGFEIDFQMEGRVSMNMRDNSLKITGAQVIDTAEYTCIASNGLDEDTQSAKLTIKDRPSPPYDIRLESCGTSAAQITWEPNNNNNDPIIDFTVYYNTSFDDKDVFHIGKEDIPANHNSARIKLSPWANYTFHVKARNSLGLSDASAFTSAYCTTPQMIPYNSPKKVCSRSADPDQLVVTWEPMERIDHNGENFHYIVGYKRRDLNMDTIEVVVDDYTKSELVMSNQETFKEYEIYVQAANNKGRSPESTLERKSAFSGEDTPLESPGNLEIDYDTLNATYAAFMWDPIDDDPSLVRGHFRGYQLAYWKADDPDNKRYTDVILHDYDHCPPLSRRRRHRRQRAMVRAHATDLWPYSQMSAAVLVLNGGKSGPLSDSVQFSTPEGFPGIVPMLKVTERGSHHFRLSWKPPLQPNGVISGYVLKYQPVDMFGMISQKIVPNGLALSSKLTDLEPSTKYQLYISAMTSAGPGLENYIEDQTLELSSPDTPGIADIEYGETSLNVSWTPTADGQRRINPGQEFYVEIRKAGEEDWERTSPEDENNWNNITELEPGESYELRIVAVNGAGDETRSPSRTVTVGPKEVPTQYPPVVHTTTTISTPSSSTSGGEDISLTTATEEDSTIIAEHMVQNIATAGWFIGMLCAILFLLIIILIVCLIKRNRGGKYPVHEKEKLQGRDPDKEDDPGFGEYTRTDYPEKPLDRDSLASDRPVESETDSLAEYGDPDMSQGFDEDGSFIKQYGTNKRNFGDSHNNTAFSTFV